MRGHIQERGTSSWRVKVFVGRDAAGVRRYVQRTVRGTRREAERELARVVVEVDEGRHVASAPLTFGELLDRWLDVKRRTVEASTLASYEWIARTYVRPVFGARKVASLRPMDLDALYAALHGRGLSARTVRICHTVMRQSLEQARRWGLIARNPAIDATPPPQHRREVDPPTVEQVQELIDEDVTLFVELVESVLDSSRESMVIKLRAKDLLDEARESGDGVSLGDTEAFVEKLEALPTAAQSADGIDDRR